MSSTSGSFGKMCAVKSPNAPAATAPARICPSPPMFQNFILKAKEIPIAVIRRGTAFLIVSWITVLDPHAPFTIETYTENGLCPSIRITIPPVTSERTNAAARIPHAFFCDIVSLLTILIRGSFTCVLCELMLSPPLSYLLQTSARYGSSSGRCPLLSPYADLRCRSLYRRT